MLIDVLSAVLCSNAGLQVLTEPAEYVAPPLSVTAVFAWDVAEVHSCTASCELHAEGWPAGTTGSRPGIVAKMVAKHDIAAGEPHTLSFIDDVGGADLEDRTSMLELRGLARCGCPRCSFDRGTECPEDDARHDTLTLKDFR